MKNTKAYIALIIVCIVWGATFPAMRIGAETFPPILFAGLRHTIAGLLLWITLFFLKKKMVLTRKDIIRQAIPGVLMLAMSNGTISWAVKYIPGGLAALIASVMPVYVVLLNMLTGPQKEAPNRQIGLGLLLGALGIVFIFKDNLDDLADTRYLYGMLATFAAKLCWTIGSLYLKRRTSRTDPYVNIAIQLSSGGAALLLCSPFIDDLSHLQAISPAAILALAYLIIFGSLLSYLCYIYALKKLPLGLVSVYAYVNPLVAVVLGFFWLEEAVSWFTVVAFITTLGGVYWINKGYSRQLRSGTRLTKQQQAASRIPETTVL